MTMETVMHERSPKTQAIKRCSEWLAYCKSIGWPASSMGRLCDIWWEFHDDDGNLRESSTPTVRTDP
jgi:hypothetical protein